MVDLLLAAGADPKAMGNFGSALDVAISSNNEDMMNKLSGNGKPDLFATFSPQRSPV